MTVAVPLDTFLAADEGIAAESLLGTADDAILPAGGLLLLAGREGVGKSTLALDAAFHLAAGLPWLGLPVPRPLRVLLIENEGPREPFRRKLQRKSDSSSSPLVGGIFVQAEPWGHVSLAPGSHADSIRDYIEAERIDLVVADPLGSLGIEGNGTPAETRAFVANVRDARLLDRAGWIFLHHLNRDGNADDLGAISGAWGQHADTVMTLREQPGDRALLTFAKLRWAEPRPPLLLERDREHATFTVVEKGPGAPRDLDAAVLAFVEANPGESGKTIRREVTGRDGEIAAALKRLRASGVLRSEEGQRNAEHWYAVRERCQPPGHRSEQVGSNGTGVVPQPASLPVGEGAAGTAPRPPVPDPDDPVAVELAHYRSVLAAPEDVE